MGKAFFGTRFMVILVLIGIPVGTFAFGTAFRGCPFDHAPCTCLNNGADRGYEINCVNVTVDEIQSVFNRSDIRDHLQLKIEGNVSYLPTDLLAGKRVRQLIIRFYNSTLEPIDIDAFRSSQDYTTYIDLSTLEESDLDMSFLSNFTILEQLSLTGKWTAFESIPALTSLNQLYTTSPGYRDLLNALNLYEDSLKRLTITGVQMRAIPTEIKSLRQLISLDLSFNELGVLHNASIAVTSKLSNLRLYNTGITSIQPGAFQGDFSEASVDINYHKMDRFEEMAFRAVLQSMEDANSTTGYIDLSSNYNFICDCHLAWLLRDNRHLMRRIKRGYCASEPGQAIPFEDFDSDKLSTCSGGTVGSSTTTIPASTINPTSTSASTSSKNITPLSFLFVSFIIACSMKDL